MAGSKITQRSPGSWHFRVELQPDPVTGARRQKAVTVRGSQQDAKKKQAEMVLAADADAIGGAGTMTVAEYLVYWLAQHARPNLAPKTHANYAALVNNQIVPELGRVQLEKLRPAHVLRLVAALREMKAAGTDRTLSTVRQRQAFRVLFTALAHAVKWRLIAANPAAAVDAPSASVAEMRVWTPAQASAFVASAHVQGLAWHAFFVLALNTGMRLAELVGLRWADVTLNEATVRVAQTIAWVEGLTVDEAGNKHGGWVVKPPKTKAGRRTLPIGPSLVALLKRHKAAQNEARLALGSVWADWDLVFPSGLGTPVQSYIVRKVLARICAVAEVAGKNGPERVPVIRVHDLRHTAATLMLVVNRVHVKVVSERLGHASVLITLATYGHLLPGMQEDAALALERLLDGAGG